mgnify:CR=1 FL=1
MCSTVPKTIMFKCIGPGDGSCPYKRSGKTVDFYGSDLFLCKNCKDLRFQSGDVTLVKTLSEASNPKTTVSAPNSNQEHHEDSQPTSELVSDRSNVNNVNPKNARDNVQLTTTNAASNRTMLLQPLLAYIMFSLQSGTSENVKNAVLGRFTDVEIIEVKDALWNFCDNNIIGVVKNRKKSVSRLESEAHVKDIITALGKLDKAEKSPLIVIDALSLGKILRSHPEELHNLSLIDGRISLRSSWIACK